MNNLLAFFIAIRLLTIVFNQTWFIPDEYWQTQEVAHHLAFGYGYLTWEWRVGIRSYAYPFLLSIAYKTLEILAGLDQTFLLTLTSPVLHSLLTATGDLVFYKYVSHKHGQNISQTASLLRCVSWFSLYTGPRSIVNNLEELFTIIVFYFYSQDKPFRLHLFAFIAFVTRSTSVIGLVPIYLFSFFQNRAKLSFLAKFITAGLLVVSLNTIIDSYFHGSLLITPLNFFIFNIMNNVGVHYGTHPWHWYITAGFPTIMFVHLVPFIMGLKSSKLVRIELSIIGFTILVYSCLGHKEFRFLSQIMPSAMIVCAYGVEQFSLNRRKFIWILSILNILLFIFVGIIHQRGPISVMKRLRQLELDPETDSILFLTPCHSTPYYSYLHRNISMQFLTCEPNFNPEVNRDSYMDEADQFYLDPSTWLRLNSKRIENITRLVIYENLYKELIRSNSQFIEVFTDCERIFHTLVKESTRIDKYIYLCSRGAIDSMNKSPNIEL